MGINPGHDSHKRLQTNPTLEDAINVALASLGTSRETILRYLETKKVPLDMPVRDCSSKHGAVRPVMETIRQVLEDVLGEGHLIVMQLIANTTTELSAYRAEEATG
jgi:hypothetical protein